MSGGPSGATPAAVMPSGIRVAKASKSARDSQKSMIPQPPSIGPDEWKMRPAGAVWSGLMASCAVSNCSCVIPGSLIRMPMATVGSFPLFAGWLQTLRRGSRACSRRRRPSVVVDERPAQNPQQDRRARRLVRLGRIASAELVQRGSGILQASERSRYRQLSALLRRGHIADVCRHGDELPAVSAVLIERLVVVPVSERHDPVLPALHDESLASTPYGTATCSKITSGSSTCDAR